MKLEILKSTAERYDIPFIILLRILKTKAAALIISCITGSSFQILSFLVGKGENLYGLLRIREDFNRSRRFSNASSIIADP